mgnify:CR=1 FL=1|jgi:hypothetical protein
MDKSKKQIIGWVKRFGRKNGRTQDNECVIIIEFPSFPFLEMVKYNPLFH